VHKGEASHGHYYSFMNKPGVGWFRIDDEKVTSTKVHVLTRSRSLVQKYKY
jgi:ubiquitin C-terminal hydrolase